MRIQNAISTAAVTAAVAFLSCGLALRAQVGDGWSQEYPTVCYHHAANGRLYTMCPAPDYFDDGLAHYDNDGSMETFILYRASSNRSEIRVRNDYTWGRKQFEGWVWIEPPTDNESVMQIFGGQTSATAAMFRLRWQDNAQDEEGYLLESSQDPSHSFIVRGLFPPDTTEFEIPDRLPEGTTLYYRVRAYFSKVSNKAAQTTGKNSGR